MTIVCPACETRYRDPPADISPTRPLQCGKCEHEWSRPVVEAPSMAPDFADLTGDAIRTKLPVVVEGEAKPKRAPIYVDTLPEEAPRRLVTPLRGITFMAVILAGSFFALQSPRIVDSPLATTVADALTPKAGPGLEIANVTTTRTKKDGISQLIVRGEIANIADATVPVPPIELIMRGEKNAKVYAWTVSASSDSLKAGERGAFTAIAKNYPAGARDVEVSFQTPKKR